MSSYDLQKFTSGPVDPKLDGFYSEFVVANHTNQPMVLLDRFGNQHIVKPASTPVTTNHSVEILIRVNNGTRLQRGAFGVTTPLDTYRIVISEYEIENGPIFIEELDFLLTTVQMSNHVAHPAKACNFQESLKEITYQIVKAEALCTLRIFANDPTGKITSLYFHWMGKDVEIPVTNFPANDAIVTFVMSSNGKVQFTHQLKLEDVVGSEGYIELGSGFVLHIADTLDKLKLGLLKINKMKRQSTEGVDEVLRQNELEHKAEITQLKRAHAVELESSKLDLEVAAGKIRRLEISIEEKEQVIAHYVAAQKFYVETTKVKSSELSLESERTKTERSHIAIREEDLKFKTFVIKTVGAVALTVVTWLIAKYGKTK